MILLPKSQGQVFPFCSALSKGLGLLCSCLTVIFHTIPESLASYRFGTRHVLQSRVTGAEHASELTLHWEFQKLG